MQKLILGTAAFGSDYGIKHDGQPTVKEIERIARIAWDGGVRVIHTSWQYGLSRECEAVLSPFKRIVKRTSNTSIFDWNGSVGVSIYEHNDFKIHSMKNISMLQVPISILDHRFLGLYDTFEIHARSVFLQGLLLMDELPEWVRGMAHAKIKLFQHICKEKGFQYYEAALGWVLGLDEVSWIIVGVNSARQMGQLLAVKPLRWEYDFAVTDEVVLDPRRWPI